MQTAVIHFRDMYHLSTFINDSNNCVKSIITVDHQKSLCLYEVSNIVYKSYRARKRWRRIATAIHITMYLSTLYRLRCEDFSIKFREWCSYFPAAPFPNNELDIDQSKVSLIRQLKNDGTCSDCFGAPDIIDKDEIIRWYNDRMGGFDEILDVFNIKVSQSLLDYI